MGNDEEEISLLTEVQEEELEEKIIFDAVEE